MEPKKNPKYDVNRQRSALFTVGLVTSLAIVIMAFEWQSQLLTKDEGTCSLPSPDDPFVQIIPTEHIYETPKPKPVQVVIPETIVEGEDPDEQNEEEQEIQVESIAGPAVTVVSVPVDIPEENVDEPFRWVETMPSPEGGMENFYKFLKKNLRYPGPAKRMGVEGPVHVEFVVNTQGEPSQFKVIKGIGAGCDEEAVRVLKLIKWNAGKQRGVPVKVRMALPVFFKLQ